MQEGLSIDPTGLGRQGTTKTRSTKDPSKLSQDSGAVRAAHNKLFFEQDRGASSSFQHQLQRSQLLPVKETDRGRRSIKRTRADESSDPRPVAPGMQIREEIQEVRIQEKNWPREAKARTRRPSASLRQTRSPPTLKPQFPKDNKFVNRRDKAKDSQKRKKSGPRMAKVLEESKLQERDGDTSGNARGRGSRTVILGANT